MPQQKFFVQVTTLPNCDDITRFDGSYLADGARGGVCSGLAEPTSYLADGVRAGVCSGLAEPTSYLADGVRGGVRSRLNLLVTWRMV
jgi:hypothetical protein